MIDVLTFGETMAAFRSAGPLRLGGVSRLSVAGAESTVAIGLSRLGHRTRWVGLVGDDEFGELVRRVLRAEGVDVSHVGSVPDRPTGMVVFEPRVADLIRVVYYRSGSAGAQVGFAEVAAALDEGARLLHVTGITAALGDQPRRAVEKALRRATERNITTCLDVNYRGKLWSRQDAADTLGPLVRYVDVLVGSDDELDLVTPRSAITEADRVEALLAAGVGQVVIKRGGDGAEVFTADSSVTRPAVAVPVRDLVGAGDAFVAGYLSALLDDEPVDARLDRAVTVAAFGVATTGDWEGLPSRGELGLLASAPGTTLR